MRQLKDVHGITLNPLLITVFVATSDYRRRDIPANITELFKKFTELLLGRWDERKGLAQQYQHGLKDFLLCSVALQMHKDRTTSISAIDFETVITRELRDRDYEAEISICMDEILNRSGLLRRDGDKIEFRHLLFQEFFAGRALQSSEMLSSVIQDEWWRRATVFYFGEHPSGHSDLARLIADASRLPPKELFRASVTIGLATQACYLSKTQERKDAIRWVVETFAKAYQIVDEDPEQTTFPLSKFLGYYIEGRDAVATLAIKLIADTIFATPDDMFSSELEQDLQQFWAIVGLLESGQLADAESLIQDFAPIDSRLLLGIHLGTFLLLNLRIADKGEKKIAERICAAVEPKIKDLHKQLLDEFNTPLIEKRNDKIQPVIEAGGK